MALAPVVKLYRDAGRPDFRNGSFRGDLDFEPVRPLLIEIVSSNAAILDEVLVDETEVDPKEIPRIGRRVKFRVRPPTRDISRFHLNIESLLSSGSSISRGQKPTDYYLVDDNYYSEDEENPPRLLSALPTVCRFICALSKLAHYQDERGQGPYRLVFVQPSKEGIEPIVITTKVTAEILEKSIAQLEPSLIEDLCSENAQNDPHYVAKKGVLGTALASFLKTKAPGTDNFLYLVQNWSEFVKTYHKDLGTYLSGFAFHKAKREVAEAQIELASRFAKVLSDIAGKLFAIPISFAAVIAIPNAAGSLEKALIVAGLMLAALIVSGAIWNQMRQLESISEAKYVVLGSIEGQRDTFPTDLQAAVERMVNQLNATERRLKQVLSLMYFFVWIPACTGLLVLLQPVYPRILVWGINNISLFRPDFSNF